MPKLTPKMQSMISHHTETPICILEESLIFYYVNASFMNLFNLKVSPVGLHNYDVIPGVSVDIVKDVHGQAFIDMKERVYDNYSLIHNGKKITMRFKFIPFEDEGKKYALCFVWESKEPMIKKMGDYKTFTWAGSIYMIVDSLSNMVGQDGFKQIMHLLGQLFGKGHL